MLCAVYDSKFKPVARERKKTKGAEGQEAGLKRVGDLIEETLQLANILPAQIASIGVGCPGPLDLDTGVLIEAHNLGWFDAPVKKVLEGRFGAPVFVSNDVDAGVYGEYRFGAGKQARCVVGIFPGTGVGGGCVYEGKIFRGRRSSCMEVGHIPLIAGGPTDGAGNAGTLEGLASRLRIAAEAAQAVYRGQAPNLMKKAGTDLSEIRSGVLASAIENGDKAIEEIVKQAAEHIGLGIVTLVHLLAPDVVVLGGGLVEAMPKIFVQTASKFANKRVLPSFKDTFEVTAASLGDDAAVLGVAAWARELAKSN